MTDLTITNVADAFAWATWPNSNYGDTAYVNLLNGERRGYIKPQLTNILGRTVVSATLTGHGAGLDAQTFTLRRATSGWSEGRITDTNAPTYSTTADVVVAIGALADGATVSWDVTAHIQGVADGTPWYGWRLSTSAGTVQRFYAKDSGQPAWTLEITLSDAPEIPSNLRPDGGAIPVSEPVLAWDFVDFGGESTVQAALRVQVDTPAAGMDPDGTTPDYDSGWQSEADPEWDLAAAAYTPPGSPPGPTYWRVNVRDGDSNESGWSDWAEYTVTALPTLVIDTPTGDVGDPQVQVNAHLDGGTVHAWRIQAYGPDRSDHRTGSGWQTGPIDWEVPFRNREGRRIFKESEGGWLYLRVLDTVDRATAVGQKTYVDAWIPIEFADADVIAPTSLTVFQAIPGDPRLTWQWYCTDTPNGAWVFQVDGDTSARVDADDITPVGGFYTWVDSGHVSALRTHQLRVRAINGGVRSAPATINGHVHTNEGVWLFPDRGGDPIVLDGTAGLSGFSRADRVATYPVMVGPEVDIIYDRETRKGAFEGSISSSTPDLWGTIDRIEALRNSRVRTARMVWGSQSAIVRIKDPDVTSHDDILPDNLLHAVRFGFVQVD